jgi:ketosteroid isomerase-like protein
MSEDSMAIQRFWLFPATRCMFAVILFAFLPTAAPAWGQAPDLENEAAAVKAADRAFAEAVKLRDRELFASFIAENATFLGGGLTEGRDAIVVDWGIFFVAGGPATITWEPHTVEVAASGDMAYTLGDFEIRAVGPNGQWQRSTGTYVSIWRKDPDGSWKVVVDGGTPPQPASSGD